MRQSYVALTGGSKKLTYPERHLLLVHHCARNKLVKWQR